MLTIVAVTAFIWLFVIPTLVVVAIEVGFRVSARRRRRATLVLMSEQRRRRAGFRSARATLP